MKNFIYGIAITGSILGSLEAIASEVPSTKWNPAMDSAFVPVSEGIVKDAVNTNLKLEGKRIAFKNSFMTGTIDGETVAEVQAGWWAVLRQEVTLIPVEEQVARD